MNEQLIAQLQLLIELAKTGEEFELDEFEYNVFKIEDSMLLFREKEHKSWYQVNILFNQLMLHTIIRKPWKPKRRETYWYWWNDNQNKVTLSVSTCHDGMYADYMSMLVGNCFRTREECESHTEVRDKLIAMRKEYE